MKVFFILDAFLVALTNLFSIIVHHKRILNQTYYVKIIIIVRRLYLYIEQSMVVK